MRKRALLVLVALLLVAAAAVYLVITRGLHGELLRSALETQLSARLGQPVHIGSAGASIFPPALDVRDVAVGQPGAGRLSRVGVVTGLRGVLSRRVGEAGGGLTDRRDASPPPVR